MIKATKTVSVNTRNSAVYNSAIALTGLAPESKHQTKLKKLSEINRSSDPNLSAEQLLVKAPIHIRLQNKVATTTLAMRNKISIDLHDSTIQPYIGLKLGLEALRRKMPGDSAIAAELDELIIMAAESISELRQYIGNLKSQLKSQLGTSLLASIVEIAKKYQHRHGIEVAVNIDTKLKVSDHLSTEIYQLVCEGLSNIHRHTQSKKAEINLYTQNDQLFIEVINQDDSAHNFIPFKPRSMTERAAYLGGTINVNHIVGTKMTGNKTIVTAKIPLQLNGRYSDSFI